MKLHKSYDPETETVKLKWWVWAVLAILWGAFFVWRVCNVWNAY